VLRAAAICAAGVGTALFVLSVYATGPMQMALASASAFCTGW
jgi:hypothetical protein